MSGVHRNTVAEARRAGLLIGVCLLFAPGLSQAIGLGKLTVHSALDEPLNAEIEFSSLSSRERKTLSASLASRADFVSAGIDRPPYLTNITFTVSKRVDGRYFLHLRTKQPFREPFLHFLLRVEWSGGRLIREYTALIDPPYLVAGRPSGIEVPEVEPQVEVSPVTPPPTPTPVEEVEASDRPAAGDLEADTGPEEPLASATGNVEPAAAAKPSRSMASNYALANDFLFGPQGISDTVTITAAAGRKKSPATPQPAPKRQAASSGTVAPAPVWANRGSYHVKRGDTLWSIAQRLRVDDSLSIEQVVMAIFQANRHAFFGNNANNLRAGKILNIPDRYEVEARTKRKARKEFYAQYDVWQDYKLKVAGAKRSFTVSEESTRPRKTRPAVPAPKKEVKRPVRVRKESPPKPVKTAKTTPEKTPEIATKTVAPAKREGIPADELLKIVRANLERQKAKQQRSIPDADKRGDPARQERSELAERVASLDESLESKQMQTRDMGERVGEVKDQLETQKRLIELENMSLAQTQDQKNPGAGATKGKNVTDKKGTPDRRSREKRTRPSRQVSKPAPPPVKPKPGAPPSGEGFLAKLLETAKGLMDELLGGQSMMPLAAVLVLLSGGLLLVYMRRRRQAKAEFEESILNTSGLDSEGLSVTDDSARSTETGDTSFLSDFSQGGMGNIHTDEVDPIAEAEVYLAYGRDEQAEEILKEAMVKDASRHQLKEKLLEIYHQRNDAASFETLAEELYALLEGRGGELWDRVAAMGRKLSPNNPMFGGAGAAGLPGPPTGALETGLELDMPGTGGGAMPGLDMTAEPDMAVGGSDETLLDLEQPAEALDAGSGGALAMDADFDLGLDSRTEDANKGESNAIDFDLSLDTDVTGTEPDATEEAPASIDDNAIEFSLEDITAGGDADVQDTSAAEELSEAAITDTDTVSEDEIKWDIDMSSETDSGDDTGLDLESSLDMDSSLDLESSLDMDSNLDLESTSADGAEFSLDTGEGDGGLEFESVSELALDEGAGTTAGGAMADEQQQWDETATKLDLAKAYIDMGDAEGARSILEEVLAEGNEEQKKQAAELAAQVA